MIAVWGGMRFRDAIGTLYDMPSVEVEDPRGVFGAPR